MTKRLLQDSDLMSLVWPANPVLSPCGKRIVYEVRKIREKQDDYTTHLEIADVQGLERRALTVAGTRNTSPVWSPDGTKLAFLSNRFAGTQVWLLPMAGGEAQCVTRFRYGVRSMAWSPDGTTLVMLVPVKTDDTVEWLTEDATDEEVAERLDKEQKEWQRGPKRYDWIYYKQDGAGLTRGLKLQLVTYNLGTGQYRPLTSGPYDVEEFSISPDGNHVAFTSNRRAEPEIELWSDIYRVPMHGGSLELLCGDTNAGQLAYSPDGSEIAFFGHRDEYKFATHVHLFTVPAIGGTATSWTATFPDTLGNFGMSDMRAHEFTPAPVWTKTGEGIFALTSREGRTQLARFTRRGEETASEIVAGGDREIYGFSISNDNQAALTYTTPVHPGKVAVIRIEDTESSPEPAARSVTEAMETEPVALFPSSEIRIDACSDDLLAGLALTNPEPFWYTSEDGWQVQGFVMKPTRFEGGRKYPVIFEIHGGPHAAYSYSFFHEFQWLAAQGYAVVFVNPRGSMSYGQEFVNACRHDYGGRDALDLLNGLDTALERFAFLDGERVAVTGGSYGGFMTNWLIGQTNRFFAAVSQRSITNWVSFYGVSDIGPMFTESEIGGDVKTGFDKLWRHSPLAYVGQVQTPLLLIHSENDLRCPIEQAEQFYTCLRRQGNEVELLRIPDANHDLSRTGKPSLRLARLQAIHQFIDQRLPK